MANTSKTKKSSKKKPQVTGYLDTVVDTTKDLLDNIVDTAGTIEKKTRKQVKSTAKNGKKLVPSKEDVKDLRKQVEDLGTQVEKLAKVRKSK